MMIFRGDKGTERLERQMATWELAAWVYYLFWNSGVIPELKFMIHFRNPSHIFSVPAFILLKDLIFDFCDSD